MKTFAIAFDDTTWSWEGTADATRGPAGLVSLELTPNVVLHFDAWSGEPVACAIHAQDGGGRLDGDTAAAVHETFGALPAAGGHLDLPGSVALDLAQRALAEAEELRHRSLGFPAGEWSAAVEPTGDAALLRAAQEVLRAQPVIPGRLSGDGPVAVDASGIPSGVLELRTLRSDHDPAQGLITLTCGIVRGVYAPEVGTVSAILVEPDHAGRVVAVNHFAPDRFGLARARLVIGPTRPLDSVSLLLTTRSTHVPSVGLGRERAAIEVARRAAQAGRLGMGEVAQDLLDQALGLHGPGTTASLDAIPAGLRVPFAGEVETLAAVHDGDPQ